MALPTRLNQPISTDTAAANPVSTTSGWTDTDNFELVDSTGPMSVLPPLTDEEAEDIESIESIDDLSSESYANLLDDDSEGMSEGLSEASDDSLAVASPAETPEASQTDSEAAETEAAKPSKRKVIQPKRTSERDLDILRGLLWMERATTTHIAYLVESPSISIARRLKQLKERGLVLSQNGDGMVQWGITHLGMRLIGESGRAKENPARSTTAHRNKKNSIIVHLLVGGIRMEELAYREALNELSTTRAKNKRTRLQNELLAAKQEEARKIPERLRTEEEMRILRRKPAKLQPEEEPVMKPVDPASWGAKPQAAFSESVIVRDFQIWGWEQAPLDWKDEMNAWMATEGFPVRHAGDDSTVTEEEREALTASVTARTWIFNHWNVDEQFKKKHQPDGVLLLPHRVQADGSVLPGSWWIEMEDSRKQLSEIVRVCKQAMDHPLVRGAIYFTNDLVIANLIKKARRQVASELALRYRTHEGMSLEDSEARAKHEVNEAILIKKSPLLNPNANKSGYWG